MYQIICILIVLGLCRAMPAQDAPASMPFGSPSGGFPARYLPLTALLSTALKNLTDPINNVESPLQPQNIPWLRPRISYDYNRFAPPNGGALVMSISTTIYYAWVDVANKPMIVEKKARKVPFPNFLYTITPWLLWGNLLTPSKLGIVYCWVLEDVLEQESWPGFIKVEIFQDDRKRIGTLEIENIPQAAAASSTAPEDKKLERLLANGTYSTRPSHKANGQDATLTAPHDFERRWFTCVFKGLLYIVGNQREGRATDELPPFAFGPSARMYQFLCDPRDTNNKDRIGISIFPTTRERRYPLTWDELAKTLLIFGTRIAEARAGWDTEQFVVRDEHVVTAALRIQVHREGGTDITP